MTKVEFETSEEVDVTPTFDTMGLREDLLRGIYAYGRPVDSRGLRLQMLSLNPLCGSVHLKKGMKT